MREKLIANKMNPRFRYTNKHTPRLYIIIELVAQDFTTGDRNEAIIVESTSSAEPVGTKSTWDLEGNVNWKCERV